MKKFVIFSNQSNYKSKLNSIMRTKLILVTLFLLLNSIKAQSEFTNFLTYVNSLSNNNEKQSAVDSFLTYASTKGIPFIEGNQATFLYKGSANNVVVTGDFSGWNSTGKALTKIEGTNLFYSSNNFEINARLDYKLILNGSNWILDPLNPKTVPGGFGANSELAMPDYIQPWEIESDPNSVKGTLQNKTLNSTIMGKNYTIKVYVPHDYFFSSKSYPPVYFQDGTDYLDLASTQIILDNLIHQGLIEEIIAVFVKPTNRNDEYAYGERYKYVDFFTSELIDFIDAAYRTISDPKKRLVVGDSFGGNISALISYLHPELFGLCGLHSAAFWPNNYEVYNLLVQGEIKNIDYYSVWGTYESLFSNMRSFRDNMKSKGYSLEWKEFPEGHSWGLWRANIDVILQHFFPDNSVSVNEPIIVNEFKLQQNFPNPFNPITSIEYSVPSNEYVTLKVYDILGNEVGVLVNEQKEIGNYSVKFDASNLTSGVYIYRIKARNFIESRKMVLIK